MTTVREVGAAAFSEHREALWGLCYRLTGSTADAEELVQDTFLRLLERPPADLHRSARPWLFRVATNLATDRLRRRKKTSYPGVWLPALLADEGTEALEPAPDALYEAAESVTLGFLIALEDLSPRERAALLLRDVYGMSVAQTAEILQVSQGNLKVIHHRARTKMKAYDESRAGSWPREGSSEALARLLTAMATGDEAAVRACVRDDVTLESDGGGRYLAALKPIFGVERVLRFFRGVRPAEAPAVTLTTMNGEPAAVLRVAPKSERHAALTVLMVQHDSEGRIGFIRTWSAPAKLPVSLRTR